MGLFDQYLSLLCCAVLSCLVMSYSLQPHGLQPARLLCSWGFSWQKCWRGLLCPPPRNLSNPGIPHCRQILYHLSHRGSPLSLLLDCKYHKERKHIQFFSLFNFQHLRQFLACSRYSIEMCGMNAENGVPSQRPEYLGSSAENISRAVLRTRDWPSRDFATVAWREDGDRNTGNSEGPLRASQKYFSRHTGA